MSSCLDQIVETNEAQVEALRRHAATHPDTTQETACMAFRRQVSLVEGAITNSFALVTSIAKKTDDLAEIAKMWQAMSRACEHAINLVSELKDSYPFCGTRELYNLLLDYKIACDERYHGVSDEILCQTMPTPTGLFPEMT
jgi:hypothetical protein